MIICPVYQTGCQVTYGVGGVYDMHYGLQQGASDQVGSNIATKKSPLKRRLLSNEKRA